MSFSEKSCLVFEQATKAYHITDHIDATVHNPYEVKSIEFYLYLKNWIDAVQWHFEDIIRDPQIDPVEALALKRRIDKSNQDRTDLVELIDSIYVYQAEGTGKERTQKVEINYRFLCESQCGIA